MNLKSSFVAVISIVLMKGVSAEWCGCYIKDGDDGFAFIGRANLWSDGCSTECCKSVTGHGLMDGGWLGLSITGKDWCDVEMTGSYLDCCEGKTQPGGSEIVGYCK